jgi:hypothetical protein
MIYPSLVMLTTNNGRLSLAVTYLIFFNDFARMTIQSYCTLFKSVIGRIAGQLKYFSSPGKKIRAKKSLSAAGGFISRLRSQ